MPRSGTQPLTVSAAWGTPFDRPVQHRASTAGATGPHVSVPVPVLSSRHLCAGHHLASQQAPARLIPGQQLDPGFDDVCTLSTFQQWFTFVRLLGPHLTPSWAPFPRRSPPRLLTAAARGGLKPPPAGRPRRTYHHHRHDTASKDHAASTSQPPSAFVAHNRRHTARLASLVHGAGHV